MSEEIEAWRDGAQQHANSGRGWREKGDARLGELFCIDYKEYSKSFSISPAVWAKVTRDAMKMRLKPALKLAMGEREPKTRLWVIGDREFHEMYEAWQEKYGEG